MTLELTDEKITKVESLKKLRLNQQVKIREFSKTIGFLVSCCPAVNYGWLYTKTCDRAKYLALKAVNNDYNAKLTISPDIVKELGWWQSIKSKSKNPIKNTCYEIEIFTDASLTGWGSVCNGEKAHGFWNSTEAKSSINHLELLAAFFGLKIFAKNL